MKIQGPPQLSYVSLVQALQAKGPWAEAAAKLRNAPQLSLPWWSYEQQSALIRPEAMHHAKQNSGRGRGKQIHIFPLVPVYLAGTWPPCQSGVVLSQLQWQSVVGVRSEEIHFRHHIPSEGTLQRRNTALRERVCPQIVLRDM